MEKKVEIERLDVENEKLLEKCAACYCEIWKEPPWNEDFWTVEGVIRDIKKQMLHPCAIGFYAFYCRKPYNYEILDIYGARVTGYTRDDLIVIVGFTWGYQVSKVDLQEISGTDALDNLLKEGKKVFYIDELGVASFLRRRGIGERLSRELIAEARKSFDIRCFILRTDVKAIAARNLYTKLGFVDLSIQDGKHSRRTYWSLEFP